VHTASASVAMNALHALIDSLNGNSDARLNSDRACGIAFGCNVPLFALNLMLGMSGTAILAALALCDHSAAAAVPPRCQMHRVVVILSGVPSVGPGGMPQATGNSADALLLAQVLVIYVFAVLFRKPVMQASAELREIASQAKTLTTAIDVHAVSAGTMHAAALEAMCSMSGGMLRLIKSFGEPLLVSLGPSLMRVCARALTIKAYSSQSLELQHVIGAMKLDENTQFVSQFKALVGEAWQGFTFFYDIMDELSEGDYVSLQVADDDWDNVGL
jgi:hypothetical protein